MVTVYDVEPNKLIEKAAEKLEKEVKVENPEWLKYVKSGSFAERRPEQKNFWYLRMASILRKYYVNGKTGVNNLRDHYGGRKNRGRKPDRHAKAGGAIIRRSIQALEKHGFLKKEKVGRLITAKGQALLDNAANDVAKGGKN
ncbi:30S ribosomal protein S19e [Candidatus Micrarchaeota archaeon]|nr:30S ribosomal protein S19e [Candidatus Micrarchaeota archaeon]